MNMEKGKSYKGSFLLKVAIFFLACFVVFSLVNSQIQINNKKAELSNINEELAVVQVRNEELQYELNQNYALEDHAEKSARRELNYAKPGEKIFVDIGGND